MKVSFLGLAGDACWITGVEEQDDGVWLKVYIGPRYNGIYVCVDDPESMDDIRRAWSQGGHVLAAIPPREHWCKDE
jgi:hypothetical protein